MLTPSALVVFDPRTRITPAERVRQRQLLLHHLQRVGDDVVVVDVRLFELQEPEAKLMLTVGLDFDKHS